MTNAELPPGMNPEDTGPNFFQFDSVLNRSGHGTVRAILTSEAGREPAEKAIAQIERLGCSWESPTYRYRPYPLIFHPRSINARC